MTDPAVEAARKAVNGGLGFPNGPIDAFAVQSAREALRPIREKWEELLGPYATRLVNPEATGAIKVLEAFAPLIFTTEELER
ncbi:hypothetical protein [Mycobacteroides abscessus]|uniref:hypothetical protein n=1 Tax=Mycobacteroides abscessus TaxID=36809 RepID=UPI000926372D|nr:hypothetical protein [Mycobacteroides abscessus]SIE08159.1 Uncharacterised protein [Mycobacteroides abscessus subsp. abscessus]